MNKQFLKILVSENIISDKQNTWKPGLHRSCEDCKHMFANTFFKLSTYGLVVGIHISQEIVAIDMLTASKPSLEHDRKHVL